MSDIITQHGVPVTAWPEHESNCGVFDPQVDRDCDCGGEEAFTSGAGSDQP